jgi:isocitrate dehydrogenase
VVIDCVESGKYTKDLAISVQGTNDVKRDTYLSTQEFIYQIASDLKAALKK